MDLSSWMSYEIKNSLQNFSSYVALLLIFPFLPPLLLFTHSSFLKTVTSVVLATGQTKIKSTIPKHRDYFLYFSGSKKHAVNFAIIILHTILVMSFLVFIKPPESISIFLLKLAKFRHHPPIASLLLFFYSIFLLPLSISVMGTKLIALKFGYSMVYNKKWD